MIFNYEVHTFFKEADSNLCSFGKLQYFPEIAQKKNSLWNETVTLQGADRDLLIDCRGASETSRIVKYVCNEQVGQVGFTP